MFYNATSFNQDLNWDVSSVTIMENMFEGAVNFNGDISNWNPINVWKFYRMFRNAESFNQDLYWDISSGTDFTYMFKDAVNFNGDLSSFNTSGGDYFTEMFCNAHSFNQDVSHFDISNATYTARMFDGTWSLSLENKCAIHNSFSVQGGPWAYDWSSACDCIDVDDDNICDDDDDCIGQYDECNVCNGDNSSCQDECGIPNGDNSTCSDCAGVPNGNSWESNCGCVPYDNTGNDCDDCAGTPNGDAVVDECGVCNGNSNPQDCNNDGIDDVCEETYDTGFAEGFLEGQSTGDVNNDGQVNVTDVVTIVQLIILGWSEEE
tara:strand:+ start:12 stop:968 length:957 start_codon:yes stop_codon:yes gene_type:complete